MGIPNKQIGWSQESNLLWELLKEVDYLTKVTSKVSTNVTVDSAVTFAPSVAQDSFGRLRVSEPYTLFDSSHRYSDNELWATATATGGTAVFNTDQGLVDLNVTAASGSSVARETTKVFSYQPGKSLLIMSTFVMSPAKTGLTQKVGYFGDDNGFYLELENNVLSFVRRSSVTGSIVETPVAQANWNYDKMDGTGPSGVTLDITKAQILWMDMEWLGVGSVRMGFVINNQFIICHVFEHANIAPTTYITTASLPLRYEIENTAGTSGASTLKQICSTVISEGGYELRGDARSIATTITAPYNMTVAGTYYPLISIRLKSTYLDGVVVPTGISCLPISTGTYEWRLIEKGVTTGGTWTSLGADSIVEYNITGSSFAGGTVIHSGFFNASNQGTTMSGLDRSGLFDHQLSRDPFTGTRYELTLCVAANTIGGGGSNVLANMDWEEISR
jgi:hypothetical protein